MSIRRLLLKQYHRLVQRIVPPYFDSETEVAHLELLCAKYPELLQFDKLTQAYSKELEPYYRVYTQEVSNSSATISLRLAVFLITMCRIVKPKTILDLGSGFSSFVFRHFMKNDALELTVHSVDTSSYWLDKTRNFLLSYKLPASHLITWKAFLRQSTQKYDFVLCDISMGVRIQALPIILSFTGPSTVAIFDDIHIPLYSRRLKYWLQKSPHNSYSLKFYTEDEFGRYSLAVTA